MSSKGVNGPAVEVGVVRGSMTKKGTRGFTSGYKRNADGTNKDGKSRYRPATSNSNHHETDEKDETVRLALLAEKQTLLESVDDRHDDLVRELFHMENFTMMIGYNPAEAKEDNTAVFREYKSKFDLLENAVPTAGPSRQTRRAHTERRQIIAGASISAPLPHTSLKRNPKAKAANTTAIWDILSTARNGKGKGKGKEKEFVPELETLPSFDVLHEPVDEGTIPDVDESISTVFQRRKPAKNRDNSSKTMTLPLLDHREQLENPHFAVSTKPHIACHTLPDESVLLPSSRRSNRLKEPVARKPSPDATKVKLRQPTVLKPWQKALPQEVTTLPSPSKFNVKRIKLIVRRPPPTLTNPRQRAPQAKYNSSLNTFMSSYICIGDADTDIATLQREAEEEAIILERVERFRRDGRFIPGADVLFGAEVDEVPYTPPKRTSVDLWDKIIETIVARARTRPKKSIGRQIASQIAIKIQAHFDTQESRKLKVIEAEERRLRNLAKSTVKLVVGEWKKAVFHIREKQRLELEAEELKRGHAHLDAILDQSGQILETQQGDLSRGDISRSRSTSMENLHNWSSDEEEEEDEQEDEGDVEDQDGGSDFAGVGDDDSADEEDVGGDDQDSSMLLLGDFPNRSHISPATRSGTPTTSVSSVLEQDDPETTNDLLLLSIPRDNDNNDDVDMHSDDSYSSFAKLAIPAPESSPHRPPPHHNQDFDEISESYLDSYHTSVEPDDIGESGECADESPLEEVLGGDHYDDFDEAQSRPATLQEILPVVSMEGSQSNAKAEDHTDRMTPSAEPPDDFLAVVEPIEEEEDAEEKVVKDKEDFESEIPDYLKPYAVAPVKWDPHSRVIPPLLLRGVLRPYQQSGLEWLASLHVNRLNGILADEMGLGKTIQTIALLAHLACDRGIWGPHLIVVPTSVLLNWEMEFKKFLPGFRILSYHGSTKRRKELRQGWNDKHHFNVCITSYTLASKDAHIFKRKAWYYMILDEAHMIKNFKSQRWNILLMFRSYRRLLLTGTPLQNNLTELWALLQFLMSGANFANLKEFGEWFSNPLEKAIEMGNVLDDETMQRVSKLHTVLRPYLLRRLKRDVEKELPSKFEHLMLCPLSKRQRFLYDEFMSRAQTRDALESGVYQKIANILMQLRKVCNHPDLFEVRPIVTSFAMRRSAIAEFEIKELLVRRRLLDDDEEQVNLGLLGLRFIDSQNISLLTAVETRRLDATATLPYHLDVPGEPPPKDFRTVAGFRKYSAYSQRARVIARWTHIGYLNTLRCSRIPIYSDECLSVVNRMSNRIVPFSVLDTRHNFLQNVNRVNQAVKSYTTRADDMSCLLDHFAFVTPTVVALDLPRIALSGNEAAIVHQALEFDQVLHPASVKLQIAFPDPSLLQYDCGKLQRLTSLLREKKAGGHRILIFTQMTRILDILEIFLNFHGYLYLRLDGATKIEDRQYITERFNADPRIFCFISSSRSGGVGINLTGADTVIFYDSDFNPQMDRQCEDRAHRIGQIRDVHIYRFVSQHTVEEAMLRKANQKRSLDDLVIQKGEFDWRSLFNDESALTKALGDFEDAEDRHAAAVAAREEISLVGADEDDFGGGDALEGVVGVPGSLTPADVDITHVLDEDPRDIDIAGGDEDDDQDELGGTVIDYMLAFVEKDYEFFREWRL
ncbi:SNF2 family N-terminal domain-containing protein [Crassisporium funariophilum]|nr:SNF2 family N-terminal domain-containing protein [Crassisporium funariophilum]